MAYQHVPNLMKWKEVDRLKSFGSENPDGSWGLYNINFAPDDQQPDLESLQLLRVPPTQPWRMEQCTHIGTGARLMPELAASEPRFGALTLEWAFDYAQDVYSFLVMWVDPAHDWVYGMIGADWLATRRFLHSSLNPNNDPIWRKGALFDLPLLASNWHTINEPTMEDFLE